MYKRHLKGLFVGALAASMVLSNIPPMRIVASDVTGTVNITTGSIGTNNVTSAVKNGTTTYTVGADGTYEFTGTNANVAIVVAKNVNATLVLNDLTIDDSGLSAATDSSTEEIIGGKAGSVMGIVLEGDSTILANPDNTTLESAFKHKKNGENTMSFSGTGTLTISGTSDDAIKYKGGTVEISSGSITINDCHGDGIQAENVYVSGGALDITTVYENASTGYYGTSNYNNITESGSTKTETVTYDTGSHTGIKAGTKEKTYVYTTSSDEDYVAGTTYSDSASGGLYISGGQVDIDTTNAGLKANGLSSSGSYTRTSSGVYIIGSPDDGLHSNNDLFITGGTINITAYYDGITSANYLTITGTPVINITEAYEGMEGADIVVGTSGSSTGPEISIVSADDGINAAHKTSSYVYADTDETSYTKTSVTTSNNSFTIYSGSIDIDIDSAGTKTTSLNGTSIQYTSSGDGIDCNGSMDLEGGTTLVYGQSSGDNSPLDMDGTVTLGSDATVLAAGCNSMGECAPSAGSGVYLTYGSSGNMGPSGNAASGGNMMPGGNRRPSENATIAAGSAFTVTNGDTTIYSGTLKNAASFVFFASPSLTSGTSYTVGTGSSSSTVTAQTAGSGSVSNNETFVPQTDSSSSSGNSSSGSSSSSSGSSSSGSSSSGSSSSSSGSSSSGSSSSGSSGSSGSSSSSSTTTTTTTTSSSSEEVSVGDTVSETDTSGNEVSYKITGDSTVSYKVEDVVSKTLIVPATVSIGGQTYKVTRIQAGALKGNEDIKKVVIGSNIKVIGAKAFANCNNLKTITVNGSTLKKVGKKAFKGISNNATIKVSGTTSQVKAAKKLIKASGTAKTVKIKKA
ncbi:MAG: carbohydrate-binding domain-containing protein [Lachnospiraceae bacterium]|nr:carbohydrate-binding domain-containing protein [Lachnospiraceae bacterium]